MNKDDLKQIKELIDSALGSHLASVHEEIGDFRSEVNTRFERIEKTMATKEDLEAVRKDLQSQINENTKALNENTEAIEEMRDDIRAVKGYAKEIDHLIERMNVVEKHVGIA